MLLLVINYERQYKYSSSLGWVSVSLLDKMKDNRRGTPLARRWKNEDESYSPEIWAINKLICIEVEGQFPVVKE